jgi:hypothetical protein
LTLLQPERLLLGNQLGRNCKYFNILVASGLTVARGPPPEFKPHSVAFQLPLNLSECQPVMLRTAEVASELRDDFLRETAT